MATTADQGNDEKQKKQKPMETKNRKRKESFIYGNYKHYYSYRIDANTEEDPRLAVFKREWFEGRHCLDIGCNQGLIAISVAKKFLCRSILGIDIDAGLVETARWNLRKIARLENAHKRAIEGSNLPASNSLSCLGRRTGQTSKGKIPTSKHDDSPDTAGDIFNVVSFRRQNFIESLDGCSENGQSSTTSTKGSGYGYADKIADGMTVEVGTVNLLEEYVYKHSLQAHEQVHE